MALSPYKLVIKTVNEATEPLSYHDIYKLLDGKADIKPSTVRSYLWRGVDKGKIMKYSKGLYCSIVTYGVMVGDLRVHNVRFNVSAPFLGSFPKILDVEEFFGDVRLFVQFGKQNRLLSGQVSIKDGGRCKGLTKEALFLALDKVLAWMEKRTGKFVVDGFTLSRFETNKDYGGTRLDEGVYGKFSCLTKQEFFNIISCVYQKDDQTLRVEQRVKYSMKVEEVADLLMGNFGNTNLAVGLKSVKDVVDDLKSVGKFNNRKLCEAISEIQFIVRNHDRDSVRLDVLEKKLVDLSLMVESEAELRQRHTESMTKLADFLSKLFGDAINGNGVVKNGSTKSLGDNPFAF